MFFFSEESRISYRLTIGKGGEALKADINTYYSPIFPGGERNIFSFDGEACKPFACGCPSDGQPFDLAFYLAMELDLDIAYLGKTYHAVNKIAALLRLWISK
ncbi:MAG: hypothetical protein A4E43_01570 [Methanosaeta sp. PtaB.Bin005]|nr:MAG: hypothetical protein A4E43_01570 [Methanosaeta sp. PtaB.Bin005]